jgi:fluoride exporter
LIWYIAFGGALGSVSRVLLGAAIQQRLATTFPLGTLAVNLSGSLLLGFLLRLSLSTQAISPEVRVMLTAGFCGGYTTFSAFSYETAVLLEDGEYGRALLYVAMSVVGATVGTFVGFALARLIVATSRAH